MPSRILISIGAYVRFLVHGGDFLKAPKGTLKEKLGNTDSRMGGEWTVSIKNSFSGLSVLT